MSKVDYYDDTAPAPAVDEAVLAKLATRSSLTPDSAKLILVMVGLPARGKSYISKAIVRYLTFFGCPIQLFNAGNKRRLDGHAGADASFFDPANTQASPHRC